MGGLCTCGGDQIDESWVFWSRLNIRKITFQEYVRIFQKKKLDWISSIDNYNTITMNTYDTRDLRKLLDSNDFTELERNSFFDKLEKFISKQTDKLVFFTCLAFFTTLEPPQETLKDIKNSNNEINSKELEKRKYIESLKRKARKENFDIIFDEMLRMAFKKDDYHDVIKIFIELVSEFSLNFLIIDSEIKKLKKLEYSDAVRAQLLNKLIEMPKKQFFDYIFNENNIKSITEDLASIKKNHVFNNNFKKNENNQ